MSWFIAGTVTIIFLLGVGFLIGYAAGRYVGYNKGTLDESNRWKASGEWKIEKGERHE